MKYYCANGDLIKTGKKYYDKDGDILEVVFISKKERCFKPIIVEWLMVDGTYFADALNPSEILKKEIKS